MANPNNPSDYVMVQLSPAGLAYADNAPLRISDGRMSYQFEGTTAVKVLARLEWGSILSRRVDAEGNALFQLAPVPAAGTTAATAPDPDSEISNVTPISTGASAPVPTAFKATGTK